MQSLSVNQLIKPLLIGVLSFALISSFALHTFETQHTHYEGGAKHGHESMAIDEYFHATEKKFFLFILIVFLFFVALVPSLLPATLKISIPLYRPIQTVKHILRGSYALPPPYLQNLFSNGILHSRAFSLAT